MASRDLQRVATSLSSRASELGVSLRGRRKGGRERGRGREGREGRKERGGGRREGGWERGRLGRICFQYVHQQTVLLCIAAMAHIHRHTHPIPKQPFMYMYICYAVREQVLSVCKQYVLKYMYVSAYVF